MHIAGEGGTGKSRVVDALRYLSKSWGKPNGVVTVAPTGIAAVLIKGETAHSKFQTMHYFKPTLKDIETWAGVYMVIWDEISMTEERLLVTAFRNLRKLLCPPLDQELRLHFVTAGDFTQLPPCFGGYIFEAEAVPKTRDDDSEVEGDDIDNELNSRRKVSRNRIEPNQSTAFQIWRSFNFVIRLNTNMRHRKDPEYGELLSRLRLGNHTEQDFKILNSRYLDPHNPNDEIHMQFQTNQEQGTIDFPIACEGNASRNSINWIALSEMARKSRTRELPIICPSIFSATKRGRVPTREEVAQLFSPGDHNLRRLPPLLPVFPGLPVNITQNITTKLGLANGSSGKIAGCQFSKDTTFYEIMLHGVKMKVCSQPPQVVYVHVAEETLTERFPHIPSILPKRTMPILPFTGTIPVTALPNRRFSIKMTQSPLTPSFAATVHKLQGKTCKAVLAYVFKERGQQKTSLYVTASRVTELSGLFLYTKLTEEDFLYFRPPKKVVAEEKRLDSLCEQTLQKFYTGKLRPDVININLKNS